MQSLKKIKLFIKHIIVMIFSNIPRLILSVCGLYVGLFILTTGILLMNSYYAECMSKADQFVDNTIELQLEGDEKKIIELIERCSNSKNVITKEVISLDSRTIYVKKYTNEEYCYLKTRIVGTTNMEGNSVLAKFNDIMHIPYEGKLVAGRNINDVDLVSAEKVVVIDKFSANLLFDNENPIGKEVILDITAAGTSVVANDNDQSTDDKMAFKVIGVYDNKRISQENEQNLAKFKKDGDDTLVMETMIYIPMSVYSQMYEEGQQYIVIECSDSQSYNNTLAYIEDHKSIHETEFYKFNLIVKSDVIKSLENDLKPIKIFMWVILIILLILSGINSMNTMFFSIKERMGEIGIKKSLGASKYSITVQFILEGVMMALIACAIAIISGILVSGFLANSIQHIMFINFNISYSFEIIYIPLIVATIYGILFSFIPSYYGANIKVTDALRFE